MEKPTSNEIVSSIFKKYEGKFLSMKEMRKEVKKLSNALDFQEPADPERTARTFYDKGILQRDAASNYCYDSSKLSNSLKIEFSQFQYLYDKLPKNFKPAAFIKIPLGRILENENAVDFISSEIKKYKSVYGTYGLHYSILKYASELAEKKIDNNELCEKSGIEPNYKTEINKMKELFDIIKQQNEITYDSDNKINESPAEPKSEPKPQDKSFYTHNFSQTIYYGVPGSGKSHEIDGEIKKEITDEKQREQQVARVVFHPEYTNADFVGQILPSLNEYEGKIDYKFKPGPFTQILRRAYLNPSKKYFLVIEEINRGNAAAIFGDLFQLLDRIPESGEVEKAGGNFYGAGWSSYFVSNDSINAYIREYADSTKYTDVEECVSIPDENKGKDKISEKYSTVKIGDLTFTANTGIRLPPNFSIFATMNTSDQNVFILDNAFQRRWDMVLVKNEFGDYSENQKLATIENSDITWETFQKTINEKISQFSKENNFSSMIDKRLGCWFVKAVPDKNDANGKYIITEDSFKNKILKYLWDDAFKFCHEDVFEAADNFESLLEEVKMDKPNFGVFKNVDFSAEKSESPEPQHEI